MRSAAGYAVRVAVWTLDVLLVYALAVGWLCL